MKKNLMTGKNNQNCFMFRKFACYIWLILFIISLCVQTKTSSANTDEKNMYRIYDLSLQTICGMNTEQLEVTIGNVYNIIDMDGNLEGYSLGYFVGNKPYGYAIYSIQNDCIKEFSFAEGMENIYLELCNSAKDENQIDSNDLVNGLIYEDGIDYSIIDSDGDMLMLDGSIKECDNVHTRCINNSIYNVKENKLLPENSYDPWHYWSGVDYDDILKKEKQYFCIARDCGLAMITQQYVENHCVGYCCGVSSATGCLNWMGLLVNGSITDTYNDMWNKCETTINSSTVINGRTFYYGGAFAHVGLNKYFISEGLQTRVEHKQSPSFNDYISSINFGNGKEGTPAIINIGSNTAADQYHSLIALSYYTTAYADQTNYDQYLGVFQNWSYGQGDSTSTDPANITGVHSDTSSKSLRYINYNELSNDIGIHFDGEFFKNVSSRNIKEVKCYDCDSYGFNVQCFVPYGTKYLYFPTWTVNNGQDDVVWHEGTITDDVVGRAYIRTKDHNYEGGEYYTHIYAYDSNHNLLAFYGTVINQIDRTITNISISSITDDGFTVSCMQPAGTSYVKMLIWTYANDQDDIIFYDAAMYPTRALRRVYYADHNNEKGKYMIQIYAYDSDGMIISVSTTNVVI